MQYSFKPQLLAGHLKDRIAIVVQLGIASLSILNWDLVLILSMIDLLPSVLVR